MEMEIQKDICGRDNLHTNINFLLKLLIFITTSALSTSAASFLERITFTNADDAIINPSATAQNAKMIFQNANLISSKVDKANVSFRRDSVHSNDSNFPTNSANFFSNASSADYNVSYNNSNDFDVSSTDVTVSNDSSNANNATVFSNESTVSSSDFAVSINSVKGFSFRRVQRRASFSLFTTSDLNSATTLTFNSETQSPSGLPKVTPLVLSEQYINLRERRSSEVLEYDKTLGWQTAGVLASMLALFLICVAIDRLRHCCKRKLRARRRRLEVKNENLETDSLFSFANQSKCKGKTQSLPDSLPAICSRDLT